MSESSYNWKNSTIGVAAVLNKKSCAAFKGTKPYVATADVQEFEITPSDNVTFLNRPSRADVSPSIGDLLQAKMRATDKAVYIDLEKSNWLFSTGFALFSPLVSGNEPKYFYQVLKSELFLKQRDILSVGTTQQAISDKDLTKIKIRYPGNIKVQQKIADILSTIDEAIEKTDSLIKKYTQIKSGLMHDLFTRGVTPDGKLRPPREVAPELYKETKIGWIPKDWDYDSVKFLKESLIDGPFGSNLKTEHYVIDAGVRVVRLANILATSYNDSDKAFISNQHAQKLSKYKVVSNDVLIAGLGEERYPVGRACLYPQDFPFAINKADCFRLRCNNTLILNNFAMFYLNTEMAKKQVRKFEQGVTRPRINTTNFNKIILPLPKIKEQELIVDRLNQLSNKVQLDVDSRNKLLFKKIGLMHDLLTGRVQVKFNPKEIING